MPPVGRRVGTYSRTHFRADSRSSHTWKRVSIRVTRRILFSCVVRLQNATRPCRPVTYCDSLTKKPKAVDPNIRVWRRSHTRCRTAPSANAARIPSPPSGGGTKMASPRSTVGLTIRQSPSRAISNRPADVRSMSAPRCPPGRRGSRSRAALDQGDLVALVVQPDLVHEGADEQQPTAVGPLHVDRVRRVGQGVGVVPRALVADDERGLAARESGGEPHGAILVGALPAALLGQRLVRNPI